jgi:hypothetical protein
MFHIVEPEFAGVSDHMVTALVQQIVGQLGAAIMRTRFCFPVSAASTG